jgi:hypothetical protein
VIEAISTQLWVQRLGWTLVHFLWQGAALAALYAGVRILTRRALPAQGRYALACLALGAMLAAPLCTFLLFPGASGNPASAAWTVSAAAWQRYLPCVVAVWIAGVAWFSPRLARRPRNGNERWGSWP